MLEFLDLVLRIQVMDIISVQRTKAPAAVSDIIKMLSVGGRVLIEV